MICAKCNHKLPVDSEFCQYCGCKLDNNTAVLVSESIKPTLAEEDLTLSGDMSPKEAMDTIMKIQAKNTVEAMQANRQSQPDDESDPAFGLIPEKPIFTHALKSVDGQRAYLDRLRTPDGQKLRYERQCSMSVDGINGMIDVYDTFLPSGEPYKTVFINMYGARTSTKAPAGFILQPTSQTRPKPATVTPTNIPSVKIKYCSKCGSAISNQTKKCTGCGKQYFKGFKHCFCRIAQPKWLASVFAVLLLVSIIANIVLAVRVSDLDRAYTINRNKVEEYLSSNRKYQDDIRLLEWEVAGLENKVAGMQEEIDFYDEYVVFVSDDGTNTYHNYRCFKFDSSYFWAYNINAAEQKGYSPCRWCCD